MTIAIPRFPATNNEYDALSVLKNVFKRETEIIPHFEAEKIFDRKITGIFIPGGFSYGDYLRAGAIAANSNLVENIKSRYKEEKIPILGICNGFQILTETKLLSGVLLKNKTARFICNWTHLKYNKKNPLAKNFPNRTLKMPIAHYEGRYYTDDESLELFKENNQILLQYANINGKKSEDSNPNGSIENIAAITDVNHRIIGSMPHPERASRKELASEDGLFLLQSFLDLVDGTNGGI